MKTVGVENGVVVTIFDNFYSIEETTGKIPLEITAMMAEDRVMPGWTFEDGEFNAPIQYGFIYDYTDDKYYSHDEYREILHQRTSNDTLQALRKLREGDQSYDWQAWLNKLDAYNKAVEETKNQATYPESVTYPQYPTR